MTCRPSDAVTEDLTLNRDRLDSRGLWRGVYNVAPLQTGGLSTHVHHMFRWAMQRVFGRGHASSQEPHRLCNGKGALYYTAASSGICSRSSLRIQVRHDHVIRPILASVPGPCLPVHLSVQFPTPPSLTHAYGLPYITAAPSITHPKEGDFHFLHPFVCNRALRPVDFACSPSLA